MIKISLIDRSTNYLIEEFHPDQEELAYQKALELEKLEIDVEVRFPSSMEQLGLALGASNDQIIGLKCEIQKELNSHN